MNRLVWFHFKGSRYVVIAFLGLLVMGMMATNASASSKISSNPLPGPTQSKFSSISDPLDRTGTLFAPFIEWSLTNSTFSGNPFDLIANATFIHTNSGEQHTTEMFYDGGDVWRFRFTGTRTGEWTFVTSSGDPDLDKFSGTVTIDPNPDPDIRGFLTSIGNKFAIQVGNEGNIEAYRFNIFQSNILITWPVDGSGWESLLQHPDRLPEVMQEMQDNGFEVIAQDIEHSAFQFGAWSYDDHSSENPDLETFQRLEEIITRLHANGMRVHYWMWGDEFRRQTPIGVGGINGIPDRRVQRYIAARLGPLPGWTMNYGFDLNEWVSDSQITSWAAFMHSKFGWQHLIWGRDRFPSELDAAVYSDTQHSYTDAVQNLDRDPTRPHVFEERDVYLRSFKGRPPISMEWTRQALWRYTMAGGHGGYFGNAEDKVSDYPEPETLRTVSTFWEGRFLLDMSRASGLTDGFAMKTPANDNYVFYKENTSSIQADLSGMASSQPAIAVDTRAEYVEISLGVLNTTNQIISLPYSSDWAVAVGTYGVPDDETPPSTPTGLSATPVGESQIDLDWQPADDPESGIAIYNVYRDGVAIGSTTVTSYSDEGLLESNTYVYGVSAVNGAMIEGDKSNAASAQTAQDIAPPTVTGVSVTGLATEARVTFSEPVAQAGATNPANFSIDNGIDVLSATLGDDLKTVTLVTDAHLDGVNYTLGVQNVTDRAVNANEIAPDTQFFYTSAIELVVSDLTVGSSSAYEVVDFGLVSGEKLYSDRDFSFTDIPSHLAEWTFIRTANNDKSQTAENFMTFEVNQPVTIHMAFDARASSLPNWLADWTDTGFLIGTNDDVNGTIDGHRNLYSREFSTGTITLGANSAAGESGAESNYNAIIVPVNGGDTPPPPSQPAVLSIGNAVVAVGQSVDVPVVLESAPDGLSGYDIRVILESLDFGNITGVVFPEFGITSSELANDFQEIRLIAVDLEQLITSGSSNVVLATLSVEGTGAGSTNIQISIDILQDEIGVDIEELVVTNATLSVVLSNVAPVLNAQSNASVDEGEALSISASITDPGDNFWTIMTDYGDGSQVETRTSSGSVFTLNHVYEQDGSYNLIVIVIDEDNERGSATVSVEVLHVFPTLPEMSSPVRDLDNDGLGLAEDLNGNGRLDFADVVTLFDVINSPEVQDNVADFDFNQNQEIDMGDITALFDLLIS